MLFPAGTIVGTPGALEAMQDAQIEPSVLLNRHLNGDWGDLGNEDSALNDAAVKGEDRVFSSYILETGVKVWIITEWDRSITTILLPEDY